MEYSIYRVLLIDLDTTVDFAKPSFLITFLNGFLNGFLSRNFITLELLTPYIILVIRRYSDYITSTLVSYSVVYFIESVCRKTNSVPILISIAKLVSLT